ncbi:RAM signaling network component [Microbotryomycetes sp. JL221]|nr:RAM signaling network component [Microbotryomycetes sp. JL221]
MAYNQRSMSPAPLLNNGLRPVQRQDQGSSSAKVSPSINSFTFPPPLASTTNTNVSASGSYSSYQPLVTQLGQAAKPQDGLITPSSSTARFHEAFASMPRHRYTDSVASDINFNLPQDPYEAADRSFDTMAREFASAGSSSMDTQLETLPSRGPSPRFGRVYGYPGAQMSSQPSSLDGHDTASWDKTLRTSDRPPAAEFAAPSVPRAVPLDLANVGRYESFDTPISPPSTDQDATSFLSPPNSDHGPSPYGSAEAPRSASRQRTYPAPLLLTRDKNRITGPSSPVGAGPQFPPPRKLSTSAGSLPASIPAPVQPAGRLATRFPVPHSANGQQQPDSARAKPGYQRHHSKTSSTSSVTQLASPLQMSQYSHPFSQNSISPSTSQTLPSLNSDITKDSTTPPSTASTVSAASSEPPITPQALLLHVLSLRSASSAPLSLSQSQGPSLRPSTPMESAASLGHHRIRSAGSTSSDHETPEHQAKATAPFGKLDTVDLSHKRIAEVPIEVIDELRNEVEKLALGYNLLKELPSHFGLLGHKLRYLNVRVNAFSSFPSILCDMPSLEILDISRNKLKRLPISPGTLANLKVFSVAKNRIKRLPTWFASMNQLKVLKVDHNPLEWPPKDVVAFPLVNGALQEGEAVRKVGSKIEEAEEMQKWLPNLLKFIRENAASENAAREVDAREKSSKDLSDQRRRPSLMSLTTDDERGAVSVGQLPRSGTLPQIDSDAPSASSASTSSAPAFPRSRPPLSILTDIGPERDRPQPATVDSTARHSRTASHSLTQHVTPEKRPPLRSKKSLPDLRQNHAEILAERRESDTMLDGEQEESFGAEVSASSMQQTTDSAGSVSRVEPAPFNPSPLPRSTSARSISKSPTSRPSSPVAMNKVPLDINKRAEHDRTTPAAIDRNSGAYFRRLSMLPPLTTAKTVPTALLAFADAVRGVLFSLSQVYAALRQFVVYASQDRLPAAIARLMGHADGSLGELINALDRFDSLSRRGVPNTEIVGSMFVTCRQSVAGFMQLVASLRPHLTTLLPSADIRYARTLVLMLFGSVGEIASSWTAVQPIVHDLASLGLEPTLDNLITYSPPSSAHSTTPAGLSSSSVSQSSRAPPTSKPLMRTRSRSRRHAGSFSVEDVQLGANLPPAPVPDVPAMYTDVPITPTAASFAAASAAEANGEFAQGGTLKAKAGKKGPPGTLSLPPSTGYRDMVMKAFEHPMTPGATELTFNDGPSVTSMPGHAVTPTTSGASVSSVNEGPGPNTPTGSISLPKNQTPSAALSSSSAGGRPVSIANADAAFVDMAESTITIARSIYGMLLDSFDADYDDGGDGSGMLMRELGPRRVKELTDLCIVGNETTSKLKVALTRVRPPDSRGALKFSTADAKRLGNDAYAFVQTVIRFAKLVKAISLEHGFAPRIREGVGQLTIATRELAKSLHTATSFRPTVSSSSSASLSSSNATGPAHAAALSPMSTRSSHNADFDRLTKAMSAASRSSEDYAGASVGAKIKRLPRRLTEELPKRVVEGRAHRWHETDDQSQIACSGLHGRRDSMNSDIRGLDSSFQSREINHFTGHLDDVGPPDWLQRALKEDSTLNNQLGQKPPGSRRNWLWVNDFASPSKVVSMAVQTGDDEAFSPLVSSSPLPPLIGSPLPFSLPGKATTPLRLPWPAPIKSKQQLCRQLSVTEPSGNIYASQLARDRDDRDDSSQSWSSGLNESCDVFGQPFQNPRSPTNLTAPSSMSESFWQAQLHGPIAESWLQTRVENPPPEDGLHQAIDLAGDGNDAQRAEGCDSPNQEQINLSKRCIVTTTQQLEKVLDSEAQEASSMPTYVHHQHLLRTPSPKKSTLQQGLSTRSRHFDGDLEAFLPSARKHQLLSPETQEYDQEFSPVTIPFQIDHDQDDDETLQSFQGEGVQRVHQEHL